MTRGLRSSSEGIAFHPDGYNIMSFAHVPCPDHQAIGFNSVVDLSPHDNQGVYCGHCFPTISRTVISLLTDDEIDREMTIDIQNENFQLNLNASHEANKLRWELERVLQFQ